MLPKSEALPLLREHFALVARIRGYADQCRHTLGTDPEAPYYTHLFLLIDPMGKNLERLITGKESSDWIQWYLWENDAGAKGMTAGVEGNMRPIRTVEDLYWVMGEA